jgi:peptidoglycan-N-acetylglucosamine deacetylase
VLVAGIAWTGSGFDVAFRDATGAVAEPPLHVPAGRIGELATALLERERAAGHELVCVVDSTNGMVDGGLMAAGLRVRRADPGQLPPRPAFGSVPAEALAEAGAARLAELTPLVLEGGSLTGRSADQERTSRESDPGLAALTRRGRCLAHGPRDEADPVVALTFDDGPNPPHTGRVLDVLARYGVPATFFCVGLHAGAHTDELARMVESGHGIGNHTWSHPFLPDLTVAEFREQLERTDEAVEAVTGPRRVRLFRPPYGSRSTEIVRWLDGPERPAVALWDVDPADWAMPGAPAIARTVLEQARPGSIVLMHDGGGDRSQTAEALPAVIEGLLDRGYRFALVEDMLRSGR